MGMRRKGRERSKKTVSRVGKEERGQLSIDFLIGMTVFALTVLFVFQFMTSLVVPYTSSTDEVIQISSSASDKLYTNFSTDWDTKKSLPSGVFDNRTVKQMMLNEWSSAQDAKKFLGLPTGSGSLSYGLNITVDDLEPLTVPGNRIAITPDGSNSPSTDLLMVGDTPNPDSTISSETRVAYLQYRNSKGEVVRAETVIIRIKVWV